MLSFYQSYLLSFVDPDFIHHPPLYLHYKQNKCIFSSSLFSNISVDHISKFERNKNLQRLKLVLYLDLISVYYIHTRISIFILIDLFVFLYVHKFTMILESLKDVLNLAAGKEMESGG